MTLTAPTPTPTPARARRPLWRRITGSVWFHLIAAFVVAGLVLSFVAKPYWVPSGSMENTLTPGDRILAYRLAYAGSDPKTGDIVVFDADQVWDGTPPAPPADPLHAIVRWLGEATGFGPSSPHTLVKRVIATPGETVECCDASGAVVIDGTPLVEPYIYNDFEFTPGTLDCSTVPRSTRCFGPVTVPDKSYFMLGDNRANSADSAVHCRNPDAPGDCWRWMSRHGVVGKAVAVLWPPLRWSGL